MMSTKEEAVEIVEVNWKIPDVRQFIPTKDVLTSRPIISCHSFFIAGRVPPAGPQSKSPPVKLLIILHKTRERSKKWEWKVRFCVPQRSKSKLPSPCNLHGKFLEFKTVHGGRITPVKGLHGSVKPPMDLCVLGHYAKLFDQSEVESRVDQCDGSLNIYFKLEVTFSIPTLNPNDAADFVTTEFSYPQSLLNDFEFLLKDTKTADVEIKVNLGKGNTFLCHKLILAARSPIFREMFESSFLKETKVKVVEVDDILPKPMEHFISFLYCGRFPDSSWIQWLPQLIYVSDKYCVTSLMNLCDSHLIQSVTLRNALALRKLAERYGLRNAARSIKMFIDLNASEVSSDNERERRLSSIQILTPLTPFPPVPRRLAEGRRR